MSSSSMSRAFCPDWKRGRLFSPPLPAARLRLHSVPQRAAGARIRSDGGALCELSGHDHAREVRQDVVLQPAAQRARAVHVVVGLRHRKVQGCRRQLQRDGLVDEAPVQLLHLQGRKDGLQQTDLLNTESCLLGLTGRWQRTIQEDPETTALLHWTCSHDRGPFALL